MGHEGDVLPTLATQLAIYRSLTHPFIHPHTPTQRSQMQLLPPMRSRLENELAFILALGPVLPPGCPSIPLWPSVDRAGTRATCL